jgi:protein TonB
MLAYAANRPRVGARQSSPNAMLFVICAHIALIAAVMSAKMVLPDRHRDPPITIIPISKPMPPPPNVLQPARPTHDGRTLDPQPQPQPPITTAPQQPWSSGPTVEPGTTVQPNPLPPMPLPLPSPGLTRGPQLITPPSELKPPYPQSKLLAEEEATLTLRLTIDVQGRVVAVDPVGRADGVFLAAARRYLIGHWRYKPAMKDGSAIASSITISLRFQLDG